MSGQQGPAVEHMELCSVLCGRLDERGVWERMDPCICMPESLCCSPETVTTLNQLYPNTKQKVFFLMCLLLQFFIYHGMSKEFQILWLKHN